MTERKGNYAIFCLYLLRTDFCGSIISSSKLGRQFCSTCPKLLIPHVREYDNTRPVEMAFVPNDGWVFRFS